MSGRRSFAVACCLVSVVVQIAASGVRAKDYFLTIGGGYDVTGNQLSLERNVLFQQSVLAAKRTDKPAYDVLFADGNDPHPDLQCRDPKFEESCPLARRMLAEVFGDADSADLVYRNNEIPDLKGPAELGRVKQQLTDLAAQVKSGDRVIIYVAAHGGKARRPGGRRSNSTPRNAYNTSIYFWNNESMTASDFSALLDRFPRDAKVVLVMVQCYAGGFAHTIFEHADATAGLSPSARCGFFAQVHDRPAAGCTPDANDADYEEYSSYFWAALAGKSRVGEAVDSADYDKNGQVSFAEAHSYAIIESDTIDIPVRTSGAFLQQYSQVGKPPKKPDTAGAAADPAKAPDAEYADMKGPISKLIATSRPEQRAILEQLPVKLGLGATATVEDVKRKLSQMDDKIDAADAKASNASRLRRSALKSVRQEAYRIWPELRAGYAPLAVELATDRSDEFVKQIQKMPEYEALHDAERAEKTLIGASMQLEREKARTERLLQACEYAVLAANLPRVAKPEIVERFERLLAMEEGTLADSSNSSQ